MTPLRQRPIFCFSFSSTRSSRGKRNVPSAIRTLHPVALKIEPIDEVSGLPSRILSMWNGRDEPPWRFQFTLMSAKVITFAHFPAASAMSVPN